MVKIEPTNTTNKAQFPTGGGGFTYPEAVAYWWLEGMPDRMDADLNGIPCETVYPASAVYSFWYR